MNLDRKWLIAVAGVALSSLMLVIVFGDNGLVELSRMRERQGDLAVRNETLARENVSLYRIIGRLRNDPVYIESVARNELGMIGKDDVILLQPPDKRAKKQDAR